MATVVTRPPDGVPCVVFALRREAEPFLRLLRRWGRLEGAPREAYLGELPASLRSPPSHSPPAPFFPSPLAGEGLGGVGGGTSSGREAEAPTPHPDPPPQGGRDKDGRLPAGRPEGVASRPQVCVLVSGIGAARARKAVEFLFADGARPSVVVAAGFTGALRAGLRVGDVLAATEVIDEAGRSWPTAWPRPTAEARRCRLFTSSRLIGDPLAKQALGTRHDAAAVDMESAAVAEVCHRHGVPFGCVRAVSDAVDTALSPKLVSLLAGGRVSPWRLAKTLLRSPRLIPEMMRLGRHTRTAARNLASVLLELLRHTSPSDEPAPTSNRPVA